MHLQSFMFCFVFLSVCLCVCNTQVSFSYKPWYNAYISFILTSCKTYAREKHMLTVHAIVKYSTLYGESHTSWNVSPNVAWSIFVKL